MVVAEGSNFVRLFARFCYQRLHVPEIYQMLKRIKKLSRCLKKQLFSTFDVILPYTIKVNKNDNIHKNEVQQIR